MNDIKTVLEKKLTVDTISRKIKVSKMAVVLSVMKRESRNKYHNDSPSFIQTF